MANIAFQDLSQALPAERTFSPASRSDGTRRKARMGRSPCKRTHPMATPIIDRPIPDPRPPMATYLRPPSPLLDFSDLAPRRIPESLAMTATVMMVVGAVLVALWLGSAT